MRDDLAGLRRSLARLESRHETAFGADEREPALSNPFTLGLSDLDGALGGGLPRAALHEVFAARTGDSAAASGFALGLALRAAGGPDRKIARKLVWVRQDMAAVDNGELSPVGLLEFGGDPQSLIVVRVRDALAALRAGDEALRCAALGAVVVEIWGMPKALDLTATRRLAHTAARTGTGVFLLRANGEPQPSAATSRWAVRAIASLPLEADAPGAPRFEIDLLRHRAGFAPRRWRVEWDRDQLVFRQPTLSRAVASASADRPAAPAKRIAAEKQWRRAG